MSKHTPGPWHVGDTNRNFSAKVYAADKWLVADTHMPLNRTAEENDANARLIAAAPDLLAALKALIENLDDANETTAEDGTEFSDITQARAAIARAEGN